jgi:uncharacterized protein with HEPN domain
MRREILYLTDILEATGYIAEFVHQIDLEVFIQSEMTRSAVTQKLIVIGEAAAKISPETRRKYPHIPWPQIAAFRNVLVHAYFGIDWSEVWESATTRCPVLQDQIHEIRSELERDGSAGEE